MPPQKPGLNSTRSAQKAPEGRSVAGLVSAEGSVWKYATRPPKSTSGHASQGLEGSGFGEGTLASHALRGSRASQRVSSSCFQVSKANSDGWRRHQRSSKPLSLLGSLRLDVGPRHSSSSLLRRGRPPSRHRHRHLQRRSLPLPPITAPDKPFWELHKPRATAQSEEQRCSWNPVP